ncbi:ATP-binding protein [candidate division KSB1 bacterium]|nr:ATP-binding protein [candidate division KSB1 bacterium]
MTVSNSILLVEDSTEYHEAMAAYLKQQGHSVIIAQDGKQALGMLEHNPGIDLVLITLYCEKISGFEFLRVCNHNHPKVLVVLLSLIWQQNIMLRAFRSGAFDYLSLPLDEERFEEMMQRANAILHVRRLRLVAFKHINKIDFELTFKTSELFIEYLHHVIRDILLSYSKINDREIQNILLALSEAVQNALDHGNLELESKWKEQYTDDNDESYFDVIKKQRLADPIYGNKKITITLVLESDVLRISVQDEGSGFKPEIGDAATGAIHGMGLMIIRNIADSIVFNESGNKVTFNKKLHEYQ